MGVKQVIVMRSDLGMRKGKMIAQGAHASLKVILDRKITIFNVFLVIKLTKDMLSWIKYRFTKICVRVNSEEELFNIYYEAKNEGLPVALIRDAGLTEFKQPTFTCLAIGPAKSEEIDKVTGELKLL